MEYRHFTTSAKDYGGIRMQLTLETNNIASCKQLLSALDTFAERAKSCVLQRLAGDWVMRSTPYDQLSFDLRGPHGSKFSLRIPRGAPPIRPEDYLLMVNELEGLIRQGVR